MVIYDESIAENNCVFLIVYLVLCTAVYFYQEKIIFHPEKLPDNYSYNFGSNTEEITIITKDNKRLNSVLFKVPDSKGVIFIFMVMVDP